MGGTLWVSVGRTKLRCRAETIPGIREENSVIQLLNCNLDGVVGVDAPKRRGGGGGNT